MSLVILIRLARLSTRQPTVVDTDAELLTLVP
jgi:hypothetical protein